MHASRMRAYLNKSKGKLQGNHKQRSMVLTVRAPVDSGLGPQGDMAKLDETRRECITGVIALNPATMIVRFESCYPRIPILIGGEDEKKRI